jgi:alanyl-tRNA synthetase
MVLAQPIAAVQEPQVVSLRAAEGQVEGLVDPARRLHEMGQWPARRQGGAVPGKTLRIVIVDGYDVEACGGIHVDNTSKVGFIKMLSSERIQDGVVRLEFKSLEQAMGEVQRHETILRDVADLWGVGYDDIPKTAQRFFNEWKDCQGTGPAVRVRERCWSRRSRAAGFVELQLP